jgi:soluble lytic murein transglycosylase-like protein
MSKGSGLLIAALVAVFTFISTLVGSGQAAARSGEGLPGYAQLTKSKKLRLAKTKKERVATYKKKRVASFKRKRYAHVKKTRYAGKKKYRYAKLRKNRSYARYQRRGKRDRLYTVHARRNPAIVAAVKAHARAAGVPVGVALAVVRQESGFNPRATGGVGEIGLMQLRCSTAKGIGYRGSCRGLYHVSTNLRYGMRYLRMALNRGSVAYYNAGIGAKRLPHAARRYAAAVNRKRRNA